ncbi:tRNA adenosine(34) deaminase TadA [Variovorax rhizosphaerae]|uniref:tRNA-specific adenosine deaminase n=1 Tax=Variovorax rhizosphaerae TaxID=1836200 RepID=A0ABU8WKH3_9BURK
MNDEDWMQRALDEARAAAGAGEVPVGAVVVKDGALIASGRNTPIAQRDPSGHAEINALRAAAQALGNYRLEDCTLYVTLEPCAMCAGAMLHARLARVVFGAPDPKTGAAGSVVDLFAQPRLNHRTKVQGGVCAAACADALQQFFRVRRQEAREQAQPLRDDALRTPDARFVDLPDWPWTAHYISDLPGLTGWRMHYVDEGPRDAPLSVVGLHGAGQWGYLYRHLIARLAALDRPRVLVPDLIGFGRSDKPKRMSVHTLEWHAAAIREWIDRLDLPRVLLVHDADDSALAALVGSSLPVGRLAGCLPVQTHPDALGKAAWSAPFVDAGYQAGLRAWPVERAAVRDLARAEAHRAAQAAMGYFAP